MEENNMVDYQLKPEIKVSNGKKGFKGYPAISEELMRVVKAKGLEKTIVAVECYPGVNYHELTTEFFPHLFPAKTIFVDDYSFSVEEVQAKIKDCITDDRVFGVLSHYTIDQFFKAEKIVEAQKKLASSTGVTIVYGTGTTIVCQPDILIYADLTRWEIQSRYRYNQLPNWKSANETEDALRKFKRGYFFEWRMADRQKKQLFDQVDFLLDTNEQNQPKMIDGTSYRQAIEETAHRPFRLVPYFDASVWGGQWMKERFGLDSNEDNFGWAFDGVPEENSILLNFKGIKIEVPATNVVFRHPNELLGEKVHWRFGTEFPIRFDYLDTMGGGNLSLQVHPLVEYAQDKFGIHYTQDESYYILESTERSTVYLGVKTGIKKAELIADLKEAAKGKKRFSDEKYINVFPVKKHDHVSIPAGTIHCGGPDTIVLEISATPYIFTFKLWDWGRTGLDGVPRPVHIEHGEPNILLERDTEFANQELIDRNEEVHGNISTQSGVITEQTGLHGLEFIETHRHWFNDSAVFTTHESVNMLNLVEGKTAVVESIDQTFEAFPVSYGETFIVPESVKNYRITNMGDQKEKIAVIQAFVRNL